MKPQELKECLRRLNMSEAQLAKLLGKPSLKTIDDTRARCIRALVLKPEIRSLVDAWRVVFPDATLTAVRPIDDDAMPSV